jgi:hypothetical protein
VMPVKDELDLLAWCSGCHGCLHNYLVPLWTLSGLRLAGRAAGDSLRHSNWTGVASIYDTASTSLQLRLRASTSRLYAGTQHHEVFLMLFSE